MASTTFIDRQTPIKADWLNDVNDMVYTRFPATITTPDAAFNGTTNDYAVVQAAIDAAFNAGGGTITIPGVCAIGSTIILRSRVNIEFKNGAYFKWIGSTSGVCVESDSTTVLQDASYANFKINTGNSFTGTAFYLHSAHNLYCNRLTLVTTGTTSTAIKMIANSTGGESAVTKRNITACTFDLIVQQGQCGTFMEFDGVAVGYEGTPQVVTLNTFTNIFTENCAVYGINFKNWVDNNVFTGMTRLTINGNGGVGCQIGFSTAQGVYSNIFNTLAVDTFGTMTGRIGLRIDYSKLHKVGTYYQNPVAEGGSFISTSAAESYDVSLFVDSDRTIVHHRRLMRAASEGFNSSSTITLADDTATSINVAEGGTLQNINFILTVVSSDSNSSGIAWLRCRRSSGTPEISQLAGGANFAVTTGVLSGTTGVDTKLTVSAAADGKYYIENRLGVSIFVTTHVAGWMTTV